MKPRAGVGRGYQWFLVPVILFSIYLAALNLASTFFLLENYRRESLWSMVHLNGQIEATMYESQLYMAGAITQQQLRFRYELLWSRLPIAVSSLENDPALAKVTGFRELVQEIFEHVRSMENDFYGEQALDHARLTKWSNALKRYRENINNYLIHEVSDGDGQYAREAWNKLLGSIYLFAAATLILMIVLGHLVYVLMREHDRQRMQLEHDSLTGLYSRDYIMRIIDEYCKQRTDFILVFIDLNKFKTVNDTYGHHVGDQLLIYLARHFQITLGKAGMVARIGGDEFIWVVPGTDHLQIEERHAQLLRNLRQPARFGNNLIPVSISSGAIHAAASHYQAKRLLEQGDSAMYTAKTSQLTDIVWFNDMTEEDQAALLNL